MIEIDGYAFWISIRYDVQSTNHGEACKSIYEQIEAQIMGWA